MRSLALALSLLLCLSAEAKVLRRAGTVAVAACPSPVTKITQGQSIADCLGATNPYACCTGAGTGCDNSNSLYDTNTMGQSFTPAATYQLYSITFYVTSVEGTCGTTGCTTTLRVDDDLDMSAEYIAEGTATVTAVGTKEVLFPALPTLTNGTTYYVTIHVADFTNRHRVSYVPANPYAGGSYRYGSTTGFVLSFEETDLDIYLVVKSCS